MKTTMTLEQAFALAVDENCSFGHWNQAERVLYKAGYCPHCACDGVRSKLGKLEPATDETYEGKACLECEEFTPAPHQPPDCWEHGDYGGCLGADGQVHSDALPGF